MASSADSLPAPRKIVTYNIADDPNGGAVFLYGNADASNIAIFCAGYPDDHENGQAFCSSLAEKNGTLVGLTCLPGYDDRPEKPWETHKSGGYTFDEMVNAIRDGVKVLRAESTNEKAKLTGIFHDWGVIPGTLWANRSLEDANADSPDELVLFDVLGRVHYDHRKDVPDYKKPSLFEEFVTIYYRIVFAGAFGLQHYVSTYLGLLFFVFGNLSTVIFGISPTLAIDRKVIQARVPPMSPFRMIYMAYPYFNMFKMIFSGRSNEFMAWTSLPKDLKKTPVLYLYGTQKRVMFHDNGTVKYLEREAKENKSKSNAIAVEDAGHWLYIHQPDLCLKKVMEFMSK